MQIAVCEDNSIECKEICTYIQTYCNTHYCTCTIQCFASAEELLCNFSTGIFDIIFLDIYLPGLNGVTAAKNIRKLDSDCAIIFITVSSDHALAGYSVQAISYIVKPLNFAKMEKSLSMCKQIFLEGGRYITVVSNFENKQIVLRDIQYVEVFKKASIFHLKNKEIKTYLPLDEVENMLGGSPFLRCHRSYLVNMNQIKDVLDSDFLMQSGKLVPIRKNGRTELKMAFGKYLTKKG